MSVAAKTVLHVDDDADDRELLGGMLQTAVPGLKILAAENGLAALELLNEAKTTHVWPCLIVLDLNMPYLNGRQTFERIKADPQLNHIPVVVLSSGAHPEDKSMFRNEGIAYYNKPVKYHMMQEIVDSLAKLCR